MHSISGLCMLSFILLYFVETPEIENPSCYAYLTILFCLPFITFLHITSILYCMYLISYHFIGTVKAELHTDLTDRFGIKDDQSFFEFGDGDISTEQLLWTIETLHTRVHKLKSQVDVVMSKNASKFSSSENLSLLPHGDVQTSSAHSPTFSAVNGDTVSVGAIYNSAHHVPEFDLGDLGLRDSSVLGYGEATSIPDIIESTVGLLSAAEVTLHQPHVADLHEHVSFLIIWVAKFRYFIHFRQFIGQMITAEVL